MLVAVDNFCHACNLKVVNSMSTSLPPDLRCSNSSPWEAPSEATAKGFAKGIT